MSQDKKGVYLPVILSVVLIIGIGLGYMLRPASEGKRSVFSKSDFDKLNDILYYLERDYYDTINSDMLVETAIEKIFDQLDIHSTYFEPRDLQLASEGMNGQLEGVGIQFNVLDDTLQVISVVKGGPAEKEGIHAGDKIIAINDSSVIGISEDQVLSKLKGRRKTKVNVSVIRGMDPKPIDFTVTRDVIPLYSIDPYYMIDDEVGYMRMTTFGHKTYDEFMAAMRELKGKGMKKLIFDLKGNGGGLITTARDIADEFLSGDKLIVFTKEKGGSKVEYRASRKGIFEEGELIILMDGGSASASEILAGALQVHDRATIVGWRSYGKGTVQQQFDFTDGSAMRLTVAKYFLPDGTSIDKGFKKGQWSIDQIQEWMLLEDLPDSIRWGVQPDHFVRMDTTDIGKLQFLLQATQVTRLFAYNYYPKHTPEFESYENAEEFSKKYRVDAGVYDQFLAYARNKYPELEEVDLNPLRAYIMTSIKGHLAKQRFDDRALFKILNSQDPIFNKAYSLLKG